MELFLAIILGLTALFITLDYLFVSLGNSSFISEIFKYFFDHKSLFFPILGIYLSIFLCITIFCSGPILMTPLKTKFFNQF